jgi:hypothetical protein
MSLDSHIIGVRYPVEIAAAASKSTVFLIADSCDLHSIDDLRAQIRAVDSLPGERVELAYWTHRWGIHDFIQREFEIKDYQGEYVELDRTMLQLIIDALLLREYRDGLNVIGVGMADTAILREVYKLEDVLSWLDASGPEEVRRLFFRYS